MLDFVNDVGEYWSKHADARVLVGVAQYWPLPYYFRSSGPLSALGGGGIGYQKTDDPLPQQSSHEIILVDKTSTWNPPGWIKKYYRLSDVQEAFGYFRIGGRA